MVYASIGPSPIKPSLNFASYRNWICSPTDTEVDQGKVERGGRLRFAIFFNRWSNNMACAPMQNITEPRFKKISTKKMLLQARLYILIIRSKKISTYFSIKFLHIEASNAFIISKLLNSKFSNSCPRFWVKVDVITNFNFHPTSYWG